VIKTLRAWGVRVDEAVFLGGVDKSEILAEIRPHIYFDDQMSHLERARLHVPSAHVLSSEGVQDQLFDTKLPDAIFDQRPVRPRDGQESSAPAEQGSAESEHPSEADTTPESGLAS
jgi:hypothetical protein